MNAIARSQLLCNRPISTSPANVASHSHKVDNQVVSFAFDEGRTATFSMVAFTEKVSRHHLFALLSLVATALHPPATALYRQLCQRETTFYGTKGQLRCFDDRHIEHADFLTETKVGSCGVAPGAGRGHAGLVSLQHPSPCHSKRTRAKRRPRARGSRITAAATFSSWTPSSRPFKQ